MIDTLNQPIEVEIRKVTRVISVTMTVMNATAVGPGSRKHGISHIM